jgi:hypothetical protein
MHNLDERGFEYGVLSKLNPEKWGGKKLEEKDDPMYYGKDLELQAYAKDMIDKDANHTRGNIIRKHNAYIGERGLYNVSKDYKKIILFDTTLSSSRRISTNFPEEDIYSPYIKERTYNNPISHFGNFLFIM